MVSIALNSTENYYEEVPADKVAEIQKWLSIWREDAKVFEFQSVTNAIERLEIPLEKGINLKNLEYGLRALYDSLDDDLKFRLCYLYPSDKAKILKDWMEDWDVSLAYFPDIKEDVFSGIDLWALGHPTASIFHMMRVLECGLNNLAKNLGIPQSDENWKNTIDQIEKKIHDLDRKLSRGPSRNARLQFLSEAAKELRYFKDGWRNYVSHSRGKYTDNQAFNVMIHTKNFMNHLAINLTDQKFADDPKVIEVDDI